MRVMMDRAALKRLSPWWRLLVLFIFCAAVGGVGRALHAEPGPLEIWVAGPSGDQRELYSIDVCFSEPMVRLGERGGKAKDLLRITPPLRGTYSWLGTRGMSFLLDEAAPPGRRFTCTIPRGTKALGGATLAEDVTWTIDFQRPTLRASIPERRRRGPDAPVSDPAQEVGHFPPGDPMGLYFDRPLAPGEAERIELRRAGTRLPTRLGAADANLITEFQWRLDDETIDRASLIVLEPREPLSASTLYEVWLPADLAFAGSSLSLGTELHIPFRTLGPPGVESVVLADTRLMLRMKSPTDPDSVRKYLAFDPPVKNVRAYSWDSEHLQIWVDGEFPAGKPLAVTLGAGLPDLHERRLEAPYTTRIAFPHEPPHLDLEPWYGAIIPGPEERFRFTGVNLTPVTLRALWIRADEMPLVMTNLYDRTEPLSAWKDLRDRWKGRWIELPQWNAPAQHPDTAQVFWRRFDELTPRPKDAQAVYLEGSGLSLFARAGAPPETVRTSTLLQFTTLGITSTMERKHGLLWITDLDRGAPVANAAVALWSAAGVAPLWKGHTDEDGIVWTPGLATFPSASLPRFVSAEAGGARAWLQLSTRWYGDEGFALEPPVAFVWLDRSLYRPGDRIEWKGFVRESSARGLELAKLSEVQATLRCASAPEIELSAEATLGSLGNGHGHFVLPKNAPTGTYILELCEPKRGDEEGRVLGSTPLGVEAYRAPRFEAKVAVEPKRILSGSTATAEGSFRYFSGGGVGAMPVRWFLSLEDAYWAPPGWEEFTFRDDPPMRERPADAAALRRLRDGRAGGNGPRIQKEGTATLDRDGKIRLPLAIELPPEGGDARAVIEMGARDLSDQSAFARTSALVLRGPLRVGLRAVPRPDGRARTNQLTWEWVVVDTAGVPQTGVAVVSEFYRNEWKTARVRRVGGLFDYENFPFDSLLAIHTWTSTGEPERITLEAPKAGTYRMRVMVAGPRKDMIAAANTQWLAGPEVSEVERPNTWWIRIEPDQLKYEGSDTARVVIPAPVGGAEALVTLRSGELLRARRISLSGTPKIEIPLGGLAPPDAVITATLVGQDRVPVAPGEGPRRYLPYHARGNCWLDIGRSRWEASIEVRPRETAVAPGDTLEVELVFTDPKGAPLAGEVALSVVDEAVLALTGDPPPDPLGALFRPRSSGTIDDDLRSELRLSPSTEKGKESPGGDGSERSGWPTRATFRATAYWNPSIVIPASGRASVRIPMPDDLTRYRLRAVASSVNQRFAVGDAHVRVERPLEVEAAAPRFTRPGDRFTLGAVVRNRADRPLEVGVTLLVSGAKIEGSAKSTQRVSPGDVWRADFRLRADATGPIGYTISATAEGGRVVDRVQRSIPIHVPRFRETEISFGRARGQATEEIDLTRPGDDDGRFTIQISPTLLGELGLVVDYLTGYPHGCLEQIDSQLLGWIARRTLADRLPEDSLSIPEVEARIQRGLDRLGQHRIYDGFSLWANGGEGEAHPYLNAYTLWVLLRARASGLAVPDGLLTASAEAVASDLQRMNENPARSDRDLRAYLTWIALEAQLAEPLPNESELEQLFVKTDSLGTAGRLCLALAYDAYERAGRGETRARADLFKRQIDAKVNALVTSAAEGLDLAAQSASLEERHPGWGLAYASTGDQIRASSLAAILLARRMPNHPLLPLVTRWLLDQRVHGRWSNTHENAWALTALSDYARGAEQLELPLQARVILGARKTEGVQFTSGKLRPLLLEYSASELRAIRRTDETRPILPIKIETDGRSAVFYGLRLDRSFSGLDLPAREEGLVLAREYVSRTGTPIQKLRRGEPTLVHLALVVPHDRQWLVLEDPLPAGLEAVNLNFRTSSRYLYSNQPDEQVGASGGSSTSLPVSHRQLLDDRARFYCDHVPAGVYHLYYPVSPTVAGTFRTPGARVELMYSPEVYGLSPATEIVVD